MTKTISIALGWTAVVVAVLATVFFSGLSVSADARDLSTRDRSVERTSEPTAPPADTPFVPNPPASAGGGIQNSTGGTADSGGNNGGEVVTGDEEVKIYVINIGPTTTHNTAGEEAEEPPAPPCDPRAPNCRAGDTGRSR